MVTWDLFGFFEATKGLAFPIYLAKIYNISSTYFFLKYGDFPSLATFLG